MAVAAGASSVSACGGQSFSIPGSAVRGPSSATRAAESLPVNLQAGSAAARAHETVLHSFGNGTGILPEAGLINIDGVFYGTTDVGGANNGGNVYKITASGAVTVLHHFAGGRDGAHPYAGLTNVNGVLYGTTTSGGNNGCSTDGCGTVFMITTSGAESVIYRFIGGNDGADPYGG